MDKYNGWTNYATWRVNLEIFDGMLVTDISTSRVIVVSELKDDLKEFAWHLIEQSSTVGLARDYALAFLSDVDWWEIANHMIADYERDQEAA
jgi:hypothetical protein